MKDDRFRPQPVRERQIAKRGIEATREIGRRQPTIPVVAITGWEYEERALEVRDAGAVDFVRKGRLNPDLVDIIVAAAYHRRRRGRGLPTRGSTTLVSAALQPSPGGF